MLKPSPTNGDAGRHRPTGWPALHGTHALATPVLRPWQTASAPPYTQIPVHHRPRTGTTVRKRNSMQSPTRLNAHGQAKLPSTDLGAITLQLEELKQVGPEWDGPGTITPEPDVVDRTAAWLAEHWRAELGNPDICSTTDGGVSISWEWGTIEHSIDVRSDGANVEWCQYNPRTLQTIETELPMDRQGWDTILAGLNNPAV